MLSSALRSINYDLSYDLANFVLISLCLQVHNRSPVLFYCGNSVLVQMCDHVRYDITGARHALQVLPKGNGLRTRILVACY